MSASSRSRFLALTVSLATVWVARAPAQPMERDTSAAAPRPNVVMVMVDAMRPDRIGVWGDVQAKTPNIDRVAGQGVFFRNIFAPMPSSAPSRATILTGRPPHTHGVRINSRNLPEEELTLAEIFHDAGYTTVSAGPLSRGREQGFQHVNIRGGMLGPDSLSRVMWDQLEYAKSEQDTLTSATVRAAVGWARARGAEADPMFMWIDMRENMHEAWRPPAPYDTMYDTIYTARDAADNNMYSPEHTEVDVRHAHALHDGQLTYVDTQLGYLFEGFSRLGLDDNTLLLVLSDHGTFMGEHSLWQKPPVMLDPLMRATLIVRYPGVVPAGAETSHLAQLSDVFATVLDLAGLPVPDRVGNESVSLRPTWDGGQAVRDAVYMEFCVYKGTASKAIRTSDWLYIYWRSIGTIPWGGGISPAQVLAGNGWPSRLLFDLHADPGLTRNVVGERPEIEADMRNRLLDWLIDSENDVPFE